MIVSLIRGYSASLFRFFSDHVIILCTNRIRNLYQLAFIIKILTFFKSDLKNLSYFS